MAKTKLQRLTDLAKMAKAKKFILNYQKDNQGELPSTAEVAAAEELTQEEEAKIANQVKVDNLVDISNGKAEVYNDWEYIVNKSSWDSSFADGCLKKYYDWCDGGATKPYKEDLWNTVAERPANGSDWHKEDGKYVYDENGYYIYDNCVRCWNGAFYAPGAAYPWCAINTPVFEGTIKFNYNGGEDVYPWGMNKRSFGRGFAIASIPGELGDEFKSDYDGNTTFDPSKLVVTLIEMD